MKKNLIELKPKEIGRIIEIQGGIGLSRRLEVMNIRLGKNIKKITSNPLRGPIIIEIDQRKVAIGRGMAAKVIVE